jgi:RNA polymerase sigma-70 factor (ECF subfamily)
MISPVPSWSFEIEGLSYDEIAEVLDVALPTVKTRLLRARRVLAAALEEWRP